MPYLITVVTGWFSNTINYPTNKKTTLRFPCLLPVQPLLQQDLPGSHCMRCWNPKKKAAGKLGDCLGSKWASFVWRTMQCPTVSSGSLGNKPHRVVFSVSLYSPCNYSRYLLTSALQCTLWCRTSFGPALQQSQFVAWLRCKSSMRIWDVKTTVATITKEIFSHWEATKMEAEHITLNSINISTLSFSQAHFNNDIAQTWSDAH